MTLVLGERQEGGAVGSTWGYNFTWTLRGGAQTIEQLQYAEFRFVNVLPGGGLALEDLELRAWRVEQDRPGISRIEIELKYSEGEPAIKEITRISKPGRRVYSKIKELPRFYSGLGISILSTPRGVMSDNEARAANVGGEVLCRVF